MSSSNKVASMMAAVSSAALAVMVLPLYSDHNSSARRKREQTNEFCQFYFEKFLSSDVPVMLYERPSFIIPGPASYHNWKLAIRQNANRIDSSKVGDDIAPKTSNRIHGLLRTFEAFLRQQPPFYFLAPRRTDAESLSSFRDNPQDSRAEREDSSSSSLSSSVAFQNQSKRRFDEAFPEGLRWAIAHPHVDFSGTWRPIITDEFHRDYQLFLRRCGVPVLFRKFAISFVSITREEIQQEDQGRKLHLHGKTPAGSWQRTLISSGAEPETSEFEPYHTSFLDPDNERVYVEAWWEQNGTVHKSWLRGKPKLEGGSFETTRYMETCEETGEDILVCESRFHPSKEHLNDPSSRFNPAFVRWKYRRDDTN